MLIIYTPQATNRIKYVCQELFGNMHGIDVYVTDKAEELDKDTEAKKMTYCDGDKRKDALQMVPSGLLTQEGIHPQEVVVGHNGVYPFFFATAGDMGFDVLSASFYLMTRYEEYLPHTPDKHGRYRAEDSTAYKNGFLELPIIDIWMKDLLQRLGLKSKRKYRHLKTIDVDNVFAYRHKGIIVNGARLMMDLLKGKTDAARHRLRVMTRKEEDPFFNLEEIGKMLESHAADTMIFYHCGTRGQFDKKVWLPSLRYKKVRRELSKTLGTGLHPSYRAGHNAWVLGMEKRMLEKVTGKEISQCRSHYLLFRVPEDYRMIESEGMTDDYSMAYSNNPGYRAGTTLPYHFYDLEQERASNLTIHPLAVMDKTLHSNMKMSAQEAKEYIKKMAEMAKEVEGEFVTLFHNENMTDAPEFGWQGWKDMYRQLLEEI